MELRVGCGVRIQVPGTRWVVNAEVLQVAIDGWGALVRGDGFGGWVPMQQITKIIPPGDYVLDNAINVLGGDIEEG